MTEILGWCPLKLHKLKSKWRALIVLSPRVISNLQLGTFVPTSARKQITPVCRLGDLIC